MKKSGGDKKDITMLYKKKGATTAPYTITNTNNTTTHPHVNRGLYHLLNKGLMGTYKGWYDIDKGGVRYE